jgi:D-alanine-D-alanine ligase
MASVVPKDLRVCVIQCGMSDEWVKQDPYRAVRPEWLPGAKIDHEYIFPGPDTVEQLRSKCLYKKDANYNLFVNLCDGPIGESAPSIEIVQELKKHNVAFTGADEGFWDLTRAEQKAVCRQTGIPTPGYAFAFKEEEIAAAAKLHFPLICKHWNGPGGSEGLTTKSRVNNVTELYEQARIMIAKYKGCLIEEFIAGHEYTVLVCENPNNPNEPIIYAPVEVEFLEGETFKTFDVKWFNYQRMRWIPVTDANIIDKLIFYSRKAFKNMKGNSYARLDWRADLEGNVFYLEMNSQPSIFSVTNSEPGSADYILAQTQGGHFEFVQNIVQSAFQDLERRQKKSQTPTTDTDNSSPIANSRKRARSESNQS